TSIPANGASVAPTISLDGAWLVFLSTANDMIGPGEPGQVGSPYPVGVPQVFAHNISQKRTRLLSYGFTGNPGNPLADGATNAVFSANARYVAYQTFTGNRILHHDLSTSGPSANTVVCTDCSSPSING